MEYDKRQLLKDAFAGKETPRVPCGFWHHFVLGRDQFVADKDESMQKKIVEGHRAYYKTVRPDMMKMMNEGFFGYPPIMDNDLRTGKDLLKIKAIGPDHPWVTDQVKHVQRIIDQFDGEVMTFYNVFSPLQNIRIRFDFLDLEYDRFVQLAEQYPEELAAAGEEMQKDYTVLVQRLFEETSLDGIYYCVQNVQSPMYTKELYDRILGPSERAVLDLANRYSRYNILHICGYAHHTNDMKYYLDYDAGCYNWAVHTEGLSIAEGRKLFPGKCILGGFDNNPGTLIDTGTREELREYVGQLIRENGYRGYILGADCSIPNLIDDRRVRSVTDAARTFPNPSFPENA